MPGQLYDPAPAISSFLASNLVVRVLIIICIMGGASHGFSRPVRTCPFDRITLNYFAHIFHFFLAV